MTEEEKTIARMIAMIREEAKRIGWGKLLIEITVANTKLANVHIETKRTERLG